MAAPERQTPGAKALELETLALLSPPNVSRKGLDKRSASLFFLSLACHTVDCKRGRYPRPNLAEGLRRRGNSEFRFWGVGGGCYEIPLPAGVRLTLSLTVSGYPIFEIWEPKFIARHSGKTPATQTSKKTLPQWLCFTVS